MVFGIRFGARAPGSQEDGAEQLGNSASVEWQRNKLIASWLAMRSATMGGTTPIASPAAEEIDLRLAKGSTLADLNVAEQLLVNGLAGPVLDEEIARRLVEARRRGIPDVTENGARYVELQARGALDDLGKRAFLRNLIQDLQHFGLRSKQVRYRRQTAIAFVSRLTIWAVGLSMLPFAFFMLFRIWPDTDLGRWIAWIVTTFPNYGLYTAVSFGAVGALFSRYTRFQDADVTTVPLDVAEAYYGRANVLLHLLIGTVGAMFMYFFVATNLIQGELVPDIRQLTYDTALSENAGGSYCDLLADPERCGAIHRPPPALSPACPEGTAATCAPASPDTDAALTATAESTTDNSPPHGITTILGLLTPNALVPSKDLALLIIWAILAGFSERLVPSLLTSTAQQINREFAGGERTTVVVSTPVQPPPVQPPPVRAPEPARETPVDAQPPAGAAAAEPAVVAPVQPDDAGNAPAGDAGNAPAGGAAGNPPRPA